MTLWAVVPAAGVGRRMQSATPKQYLPLADSTVIEQTLDALLKVSLIEKVVVSIGPDDGYWRDLSISQNPQIAEAKGGRERQDSVLNALDSLSESHGAAADDWVLIHDAVRPCVAPKDIESLVSTVMRLTAKDTAVGGGLLAAAMDNTVKEAEALEYNLIPRVIATRNRDLLWQALTPQLFPLGLLRQALRDAADGAAQLTDESSALERLGYQPLLVEGAKTNIKITHASDLVLAEAILASR